MCSSKTPNTTVPSDPIVPATESKEEKKDPVEELDQETRDAMLRDSIKRHGYMEYLW